MCTHRHRLHYRPWVRASKCTRTWMSVYLLLRYACDTYVYYKCIHTRIWMNSSTCARALHPMPRWSKGSLQTLRAPWKGGAVDQTYWHGKQYVRFNRVFFFKGLLSWLSSGGSGIVISQHSAQCLCMCMYIVIYIFVRIYWYIYIYIYMHTYMYVYIYIYLYIVLACLFCSWFHGLSLPLIVVQTNTFVRRRGAG